MAKESRKPAVLSSEGSEEALPLIAFGAHRETDFRLVPAPRQRDWIENEARSARRCLPLMMANQAGWLVLNNTPFTATWDGGNQLESISIEYDAPPPVARAHSSFGFGILSFGIPFLFRTPPGYNLLARGPANMPKDGIAPLEGLVETDWAVSTFTMNWKLTRVDTLVRFERDEPICMLLPQRRGELERFVPERRSYEDDPKVEDGLDAFNKRRRQSLLLLFVASNVPGAGAPTHEGDYMRGISPQGEPAPEHQRKLDLRPFPAA